MKGVKLCVGVITLGCVACLHSPPNYPGAGGNNLNPAEHVAAKCPNLSGRYQGIGELVEGDASAQQAARKWGISNVFPFRDNHQAQEVLAASRSSDGRYAAPSFVLVTMAGRIAKLNLHYEDGKSIEYFSSFEDRGRFVCTGPYGIISWGGASEGGRSEYGPNRSDSVVTLYLDPSANLILERGMQVHMSLRLGLIPTGTAKYFAIYRFSRLPD